MKVEKMRTREQARKNWIKAQKRAEKYGAFTIQTRTEEYKKMVVFYQNCPQGHDVDHTTPLAGGGSHVLENLRYLPTSLNRSLGGKMSRR